MAWQNEFANEDHVREQLLMMGELDLREREGERYQDSNKGDETNSIIVS